MTKNINIITDPNANTKKTNKKPSSKKRNYITDELEIQEALKDFVQVKDQKDCKMLIPGKTQIRVLNKCDGGLRKIAFFVKVTDDGIMLKLGTYHWRVAFDKNEIYAKMDAQENLEKIRFVDFFSSKCRDGKLQLVYNGKNVSIDKLIDIYAHETL